MGYPRTTKRTTPDPRTGAMPGEATVKAGPGLLQGVTVEARSGFSVGDIVMSPRTGELLRVARVASGKLDMFPLSRTERLARWLRANGRDWAEGCVTRLAWGAVGTGWGALLWGCL